MLNSGAKLGPVELTTPCTYRGLGSRETWIKHNGEPPPGVQVCHRCDNPGCDNLEHLFLGTPSENQRDSLYKNRSGRRKLTVEQVKEIRSRYKRTGYHQSNKAALAIEFGISNEQCEAIIRKAYWRDV